MTLSLGTQPLYLRSVLGISPANAGAINANIMVLAELLELLRHQPLRAGLVAQQRGFGHQARQQCHRRRAQVGHRRAKGLGIEILGKDRGHRLLQLASGRCTLARCGAAAIVLHYPEEPEHEPDPIR
jgi:hypothetical protein